MHSLVHSKIEFPHDVTLTLPLGQSSKFGGGIGVRDRSMDVFAKIILVGGIVVESF
jgi:hypothetical protein